MISVLSLLVAALAVFFGPLVTWSVARQQITVTTRETWLREFREQVVPLISVYAAFREHVRTHTTGDPEKEKRLAELNADLNPRYQMIRLLVVEKGPQYAALQQDMDKMLAAPTMEAAARVHEFITAAEAMLRRERLAIETDPGVWRALRDSLGLGRRQPWSRFVAWCRRDPPRFPT